MTASTLEEASVPTNVIVAVGSEEKVAAKTKVEAACIDDDDAGYSHACSIRLLESEVRVLSIFRETAKWFEEGKLTLPGKPCQPVSIRVAGGWVRDKLLGLDSDDVDITMDCLTGVEFATLVQQYYVALQEQQRTENSTGEIVPPKMGVIAANPSQSKHLETATMKVEGLEVDFCNLRTNEVYSEDSRIPTTEFGTPAEDAQRRDFCLNALFFNLQTNQVEDWSGRGISDLFHTPHPFLRTPLPPMETFHDDPLRVLRAIRFAVRFDATMVQELVDACQSEHIHDKLMQKVSRERVGKELEGMLSGKSAKPAKALQTIAKLGLAPCVFPCMSSNGDGDFNSISAIDQSVNSLSRLEVLHRIAADINTDTKLDTRLLHLAVFLYPHRDASYKDKGKDILQVEYMMREGIKFKNKDVTGIVTIMRNVNEMSELLNRCYQQDSATSLGRLELGLWVRSCRDLWLTALFVAAASNQMCVETVKVLLDQIVSEHQLDLCWKTQPLLNGKAMIGVLGLPKGPVVGLYMEEQVRWMLQFPSGTQDELILHLRDYSPPTQGLTKASMTKKPRVERS